ncbi:hypothetical protein MUN78_06925 [Leucobacter allii]|uniref:Phage tail protein n=1 Tax=Leucobacter allii TaxID=2932247 RepID=A0ABY4FQH8_9MICO|nr:hypothetical protein [Leucobacter allii]UOQ58549.1 hypothetical protein MUN78_06925 [Leucobacter allii]
MRVLLHETVTGDAVSSDLDVTEATWSTGVCRADEVRAVVPGYTGKSIWQYMVPRKFTISISDDDRRVRAAGMLSIPVADSRDDGMHRVTLPGAGIESIFERRYVLPPAYWPLVDAEGNPIAARDTRITGVEYGTMMKRLYQQAMSHPGAALPVSWEPDRSGSRQGEWSAIDGKPVQEAVADIADLEGGVEWDWVPQLDENDRLTWSLITARDSVQEITSAFWHTWQVGGEEPDLRELQVKVSPEFMVQTAFMAGGRRGDQVMLARATGSDLIDAGLPLSEDWDSSHSSVSVQATLDSWARRRLDEGAAPVQYWRAEVRADRAAGLRHGDWCTIEVLDHWLIPDGSYERRILEVSGTSDSEWLGVVVAGMSTW